MSSHHRLHYVRSKIPTCRCSLTTIKSFSFYHYSTSSGSSQKNSKDKNNDNHPSQSNYPPEYDDVLLSEFSSSSSSSSPKNFKLQPKHWSIIDNVLLEAIERKSTSYLVARRNIPQSFSSLIHLEKERMRTLRSSNDLTLMKRTIRHFSSTREVPYAHNDNINPRLMAPPPLTPAEKESKYIFKPQSALGVGEDIPIQDIPPGSDQDGFNEKHYSDELSPGDYVELRSLETRRYAMFVRKFTHNTGVFLNSKGVLTIEKFWNVSYRVPQAFVMSEKENDFRDILIVSNLERAMANDLGWVQTAFKYIKQLREYELQLESVTSFHRSQYGSSLEAWDILVNSKTDDNDIVAQEHKLHRWPLVTSHDITKMHMRNIYRTKGVHPRKPLEAEKLVVHLDMMQDPTRFIFNSFEQSFQSSFHVLDPETQENVILVRDWIRSNSSKIKSFVQKVNKHFKDATSHPFDNYNLVASYSGKVPPSRKVKFDDNDQRIIRFIQMNVTNTQKVQVTPWYTLTPAIFKQIIGYERPHYSVEATSADFLRSIGVYTPWDNLSVKTNLYDLSRWEDPFVKANLFDSYKECPESAAVQREQSTIPDYYSTEQPLSKEFLECINDKRHDFGDMPVYIIDDIDAKELDDGISIEEETKIQRDEHYGRRWWIHVHVSDPTAVLTPLDDIAKTAFKRTSAMYLPETALPMLPPSFINSTNCSLGKHSSKDDGTFKQRTMTFSSLINENGFILDRKVTQGIIRNPKTTTYDSVDDFISAVPKSTQHTNPLLYIGQNERNYQPKSERRYLVDLNGKDVDNILLLNSLMRAVKRNRVKSGAMSWSLPKPNLDVRLKDTPSSSSSYPFGASLQGPVHVANLPNIGLFTPRDDYSFPSQAREMVAEAMILAGRAAAYFTSTSEIAGIFRIQPRPYGWEQLKVYQELQGLRDENGRLSLDVTARKFHTLEMTPAVDWSEPGLHMSMGIDDPHGYIRVTSPLRRYSDLVMHWQIRSIMMNWKTDSELVRKNIVHLATWGNLSKRISKNSTASWCGVLLKYKLSALRNSKRFSGKPDPRILTEQEASLLSNLSATVIRKGDPNHYDHSMRYAAIITALGIEATIVTPSTRDVLAPGETHHVDIDLIVLDNSPKIILKLR